MDKKVKLEKELISQLDYVEASLETLHSREITLEASIRLLAEKKTSLVSMTADILEQEKKLLEQIEKIERQNMALKSQFEEAHRRGEAITKELCQLEGEKYKLFEERKELQERIDQLENFAISQMPNKVKRIFKSIGITTDADMIIFSRGEFEFTDEREEEYIDIKAYRKAKTELDRFLSIKGVGYKAAAKAISSLSEWTD